MTIFFTSDLHFGHATVARLRGYDNPNLTDMERANQHDQRIIDMINAHVGVQDELYILGDVSSGSHGSVSRAAYYISQLHPPTRRLHLILGNHETRSCNALYHELYPLFGEIANRAWLDVVDKDGREWHVMLSHYPYQHLMDGESHEHMSTNATSIDLNHHAPQWYGHTHERLLHGHTHSPRVFDFPDRAGGLDQIHVGWDAWHRPVSLPEILLLVDHAQAQQFADKEIN